MIRSFLFALCSGLTALALLAAPASGQTCSCTTYPSAQQMEDLSTTSCQIDAYEEAQIRAALH